jgi:hypothetical protein
MNNPNAYLLSSIDFEDKRAIMKLSKMSTKNNLVMYMRRTFSEDMSWLTPNYNLMACLHHEDMMVDIIVLPTPNSSITVGSGRTPNPIISPEIVSTGGIARLHSLWSHALRVYQSL